MSVFIEGTGFRIGESKFDFFFGRVTSTPGNMTRSLQNAQCLRQFGIREEIEGLEQLMEIFREGLSAPERLPRREDQSGVTIRRVVQLENSSVIGELEFFYLYRNGDLWFPKLEDFFEPHQSDRAKSAASNQVRSTLHPKCCWILSKSVSAFPKQVVAPGEGVTLNRIP